MVYCNDEKTRTFVSIRVNYGSDKLTPLVRDLDKKLAMYKLPPFYKVTHNFIISISLFYTGTRLSCLVSNLIFRCADMYDYICDSPDAECQIPKRSPTALALRFHLIKMGHHVDTVR